MSRIARCMSSPVLMSIWKVGEEIQGTCSFWRISGPFEGLPRRRLKSIVVAFRRAPEYRCDKERMYSSVCLRTEVSKNQEALTDFRGFGCELMIEDEESRQERF